MSPPPGIRGVVAEFTAPDELVAATRRIRAAGFRRIEAYTPFPIDELGDLLAGRAVLLPLVIFGFGLLGLLVSYFMQYWMAAIDYPLNIGGRPLNSWPAFGPISFEITVLWAVASGFFAWFIVNRLPRLADPLGSVPGFDRATIDRFFLCIAADDPRFDAERLRWLLERSNARRISDVPE